MFAATSTSERRAAAQAQTLMNLMLGKNAVVVDGVVGEQTRAVFKGLPSTSKELVEQMVKNRNSGVLASLKVEQALPGGNWITHQQALGIIRDVVGTHGAIRGLEGSTEGYLEWLLDLEPATKNVGGLKYYNASSERGPYKGLFQVGPGAYSDVVKSGRTSLPPFSVGAFDPIVNTTVALMYAQLLVGYLRSGAGGGQPYTGKITKEVLYAAHNQGARGLLDGAKNAGNGGQSSKATTIIAQALEQIKKS